MKKRGSTTADAEICAGSSLAGAVFLYLFLAMLDQVAPRSLVIVLFVGMTMFAMVFPLFPLLVFSICLPNQKSFASSVATT